MKTRRALTLLTVLLGLMVSREAQAFYNPTTGRWLSRDPVEERGGWNVYALIGNRVPNAVDKLGREIYPPEVPPDPPPPLGKERLGFEMCRRNALGGGAGTRIANECCGGVHSFLRQKFLNSNGEVDYRGYGFNDSGGPPFLEGDSQVKPKYSWQLSCAACRKTEARLQNGNARAKRGKDATDDEIWECITKTPNSRPHSLLRYNCWDWAKEAARKCGLSCPKPGPLQRGP